MNNSRTQVQIIASQQIN